MMRSGVDALQEQFWAEAMPPQGKMFQEDKSPYSPQLKVGRARDCTSKSLRLNRRHELLVISVWPEIRVFQRRGGVREASRSAGAWFFSCGSPNHPKIACCDDPDPVGLSKTPRVSRLQAAARCGSHPARTRASNSRRSRAGCSSRRHSRGSRLEPLNRSGGSVERRQIPSPRACGALPGRRHAKVPGADSPSSDSRLEPMAPMDNFVLHLHHGMVLPTC